MDIVALREEMIVLAQAIYDTPVESSQRVAVVAAYETRLNEIISQFGGEDNTPATIDAEGYSLYSDLYKDKVGIRPRNPHITLSQIRSWLRCN